MESPTLVDGRGHTIEQLFGGKLYYLAYFQREFVWERPQIEKLISELAQRFIEQWDRAHERSAVERYDTYFLGPIVSYDEEGKRHLVDGQQRFMTLLLLLIHVRRLLVAQDELPSVTMVDRVVVSHSFGDQTYALSVPEYTRCINALYNGQDFPTENEVISIRRLVRGYRVIEEVFPPELHEALPYFADWLLNRVSLVEIQAGGKNRAWEVYQAMNDRGVQLTPMELLKGFLLAKSPEVDRMRLRDRWQEMVSRLDVDERKGVSSEYIKTLLRSKYVPIDNDGVPSPEELMLVEEAPHEWIRFRSNLVFPSQKDGDFGRLIEHVVAPLGVFYAQLLRAQTRPPKGWEAVLYNHRNGLERQFDLTLAAAKHEDSVDDRSEKVGLVAKFIDLLLVRSVVNNVVFRQEDLDAVVSRLLGDVRRAATVEDLRSVLSKEVSQPGDFSGVRSLRLRDTNRTFVRYFLARLTAWLEVGVGNSDPVLDYLAEGETGSVYQIEHLLADPHGQYSSQVSDPNEFRLLRSRLGALVLLHGRDNASLKEKHLSAKVLVYKGKNYLAGSLHPATYGVGETRFRSFIKAQNLEDLFAPYADGVVAYIEGRGILYHALAERVWDPMALGLGSTRGVQASSAGATAAQKRKKRYDVDFPQLVAEGVIPPGTKLAGRRHGVDYVATVETDGTIRTSSGGCFPAPSAAAMDALNVPSSNGWTFWSAEVGGQAVRLDALRAQYMARKDAGS